MTKQRLTLAILSAALTGCKTTKHGVVVEPFSKNMRRAVQSRASFDFKCDVGAVRVTQIATTTALARGCGKEAMYVIDGPCGLGLIDRMRCGVSLNSEVRDVK